MAYDDFMTRQKIFSFSSMLKKCFCSSTEQHCPLDIFFVLYKGILKAGFHMIADHRFHMIADHRSQIADNRRRCSVVCDRLRSYGNILLRSFAM